MKKRKEAMQYNGMRVNINDALLPLKKKIVTSFAFGLADGRTQIRMGGYMDLKI